MTPQLEHDYEEDSLSMGSLRETELRLGPPGSNRKEEGDKPVTMLGFLSMGTSLGAKRGFSDAIDGNGMWVLGGGEAEAVKGGALGGGVKDDGGGEKKGGGGGRAPAAKAQVVGWPPIRNHRKITMAANPPKNIDDAEDKHGLGCLYVKVSMDGAPYLRKVDLRVYCNYKELSSALEKMFSCFIIGQCGSHGVQSRDGVSENRLNDRHGSEFVLTYEDKDGDWMLVGDVPWGMFTDTCKRLRIMKGSDAIGLAPRAVEKCKKAA